MCALHDRASLFAPRDGVADVKKHGLGKSTNLCPACHEESAIPTKAKKTCNAADAEGWMCSGLLLSSPTPLPTPTRPKSATTSFAQCKKSWRRAFTVPNRDSCEHQVTRAIRMMAERPRQATDERLDEINRAVVIVGGRRRSQTLRHPICQI